MRHGSSKKNFGDSCFWKDGQALNFEGVSLSGISLKFFLSMHNKKLALLMEPKWKLQLCAA